MTKVPKNALAFPIEERAMIALRVAVGKVIAEHARLGLPIYVWCDGEMVELCRKELQAEADRALAESDEKPSLL
jgi:hypothetical protein